MMTSAALGYRRNKRDRRDKVALPRTKEISVYTPLDLIHHIYNQKGLNSCVANAILLALDIAFAKGGISYREYSRLYAYYHARIFNDDQNVDGGTYIRDGFKGINRYGLCKNKHWKYQEKNVNKNPGFLNRLRGFNTRKLLKFKRLKSVKICDQVDSYLGAAQGVVFGTRISNKFQEWKSKSAPLRPPTSKEKILGGHALAIVDSKITKSRKSYVIANSWGENYGDNGFCLMDESYIKWPQTRDFTIVELA